MKTVKIAVHPTTGNVITPSAKNPEWGTIRVDSEHRSFENGILNIQKRSAFVRGKLVDFGLLGLRAGQTLPGKIVKRESFTPFYEGQEAKINPTTGEKVLTAGRETFIEFVYTDNMDAPSDVWVGETPAGVVNATQEQLEEQAA
jgi:hypothetical protein